MSETDEMQERRARRLREELGLNDEGVQVVLHLREQVVELQVRVRELEMQVNRHSRRRAARLALYQTYYEASWQELPESKEEDDAAGLG